MNKSEPSNGRKQRSAIDNRFIEIQQLIPCPEHLRLAYFNDQFTDMVYFTPVALALISCSQGTRSWDEVVPVINDYGEGLTIESADEYTADMRCIGLVEVEYSKEFETFRPTPRNTRLFEEKREILLLSGKIVQIDHGYDRVPNV